MTPEQETEVLHKQLQATMQRVQEADSYIEKMGAGAVNVMLAVSGSCMELNALMKALFFAHNEGRGDEYEMLKGIFNQQLHNFMVLIESKFGTIKPDEPND